MDKFAVSTFFESLLLLALFLFLGHGIKSLFLKKYIIPSSLIGGFLALLLGPDLLGGVIGNLSFLSDAVPKGMIPAPVVKIWKEIPGYLITVVFAGLFLGREIPGLRKILKNSMPNLGFGYSLALGQYVVGLSVAALLIKPLFDVDAISGALIAIGFQGGHGTVAGLQSTFNDLNFPDGFDLGLGIATIGLVAAILFGTVMSNVQRNNNDDDHEMKMSDNGDDKSMSIKKVSFPQQIAILSITIILGWLILQASGWAETLLFSNTESKIVKYIPLFPVAMIAGLLVQLTAEKAGISFYISRKHINFISNTALDFLIIAALGSLSLQTLKNNWEVLLILGGTGVAYNVAIYFVLARHFFGRHWKYRALGELGQSMGTTAIGLILIKRAGTNADDYIRSFSYKQPLYEPIVGGGLVTGMALPLIRSIGPWWFAGIMLVALLSVWVGFYFYQKNQD